MDHPRSAENVPREKAIPYQFIRFDVVGRPWPAPSGLEVRLTPAAMAEIRRSEPDAKQFPISRNQPVAADDVTLRGQILHHLGQSVHCGLPSLSLLYVGHTFAPQSNPEIMKSISTKPTSTISGNTLTLTWPGDHLVWYAQSNSVSLVNTNFWFDIPGSQLATNLVIPISPAQTNVFYRLRNP